MRNVLLSITFVSLPAAVSATIVALVYGLERSPVWVSAAANIVIAAATSIGVCLLWKTLSATNATLREEQRTTRQTRRANEIARSTQTFEQDLARLFLNVRGVLNQQSFVFDEDRYQTIGMQLWNYGRHPASSIRVLVQAGDNNWQHFVPFIAAGEHADIELSGEDFLNYAFHATNDVPRWVIVRYRYQAGFGTEIAGGQCVKIFHSLVPRLYDPDDFDSDYIVLVEGPAEPDEVVEDSNEIET